ncbi:MAG: hypothetical protein OJF47_000658 [Nitrospira sp.]|jgi:hypothetical protein|nr:MAG: hypothetical protein OJF47_000658 [Nitrospira sp.]
MPLFGTDTSNQTGKFACATATQRTLKDLRTKRKGQPVFVVGHRVERKGTEAAFEVFNDRLAVIRFEDDVRLGYDPIELLLPTDIDEQGVAYFEIRTCRQCEQFFPLTSDECDAEQEPTICPTCSA